MESIYLDILILLLLIGIVIWIRYNIDSTDSNDNFVLTQSPSVYAPVPYVHRPLLHYFSSQPSGYDSGTRNYSNPFFALEVAQGLDTY